MTSSADLLKQQRALSAKAVLPGNLLFLQTILDASDCFAFETANEGKGGPFGAQLWLVNPNLPESEWIIVAADSHAQDSNAVVSKGLASQHAEAENLSPEKRAAVSRFLEKNQGQGWQVMQVSSGESCPSCRSKQYLFANELVEAGLIEPGDFHVLFKTGYQSTKDVAGFNDQPFDQTFRAILSLGLLNTPEGLLGLKKALLADPLTAAQVQSGALVYNNVEGVDAQNIPQHVNDLFQSAADQPFALIVTPEGQVLSFGVDERSASGEFENMAVIRALHKASGEKKKAGISEPWNLRGAILYTNIRDLGPASYAETLWYNLSTIKVVNDYASDAVNDAARETDLPNSEAFRAVADEYGAPGSLLNVANVATLGGASDPQTLTLTPDAGIAQILWFAKMRQERLLGLQAQRLDALAQAGLSSVRVLTDKGLGRIDLGAVVASSRQSSNYDGKEGNDPDANARPAVTL